MSDLPILFCLHYLGGSSREWKRVAELVREVRCVALDLPGFGDAATAGGYSVSGMAATIVATIRHHAPEKWMLAGHSMGAKVAAVIARSIESESIDLPGFEGLVLLAGSPPSPEPMHETQRGKMLGMFAGDGASRRADAESYVDENSEHLDPAAKALAVDDALRMNRAAWSAWLESGSREDWADRIGVFETPALILAGAEDPMLGPDGQRKFVLPHFARARIVTLAETKHLLPLRRPHEVAAAIDEFVRSLPHGLPRPAAIPQAYRELIASDRVSAKTREALFERGEPDDPQYEPAALGVVEFATLRAVLDRVVPQDGSANDRIDLAARIDRELAAASGDGWRFAILPADADAYRDGLRTLNASAKGLGSTFALLDEPVQDAILANIASGDAATADSKASHGPLDRDQMRAWFEDLRADAVRAYLGHPATYARLGYSGFAYGGDGETKTGFARIGPDEREPWEPIAESSLDR